MLLVKMGGGDFDIDAIADDLASLDRPFVLLHGANKLRDRLATELGRPPQVVESISGYTSVLSDEDAIDVLLAAYAEWGPACEARFNGMWAFAIWDAKEKMLFLSCDRFGVKPLFWHFDGRRFAFNSEMKAFLALPGFDAGFDGRAVATAILHAIPFEGTSHALLSGVRRLAPGHSLTVRLGQTPKPRRWRRTLDHLPDPPLGLGRQIAQFRELLFESSRPHQRCPKACPNSLA